VITKWGLIKMNKKLLALQMSFINNIQKNRGRTFAKKFFDKYILILLVISFFGILFKIAFEFYWSPNG